MSETPSILDLMRQQGVRIVRDAVIIAALIVGVTFLFPNRYTAVAVLLPPAEESDLGGLLSGLAGSPALSRAFGLESSDKTNLYLGVLQSESVKRRLIQRFDLLQRYKKKDVEKAGEELDRHTGVVTTPEGFVRIEVTEKDRQLAADLANAYSEELDQFLRTNTNTNARHRREYLDARVAETRESLSRAEDALRDLQVTRKMPMMGADQSSASAAIGELMAEKVRREVELGTLESVSRTSNPRVTQLRAEIAQFDREIAKMPPAATAGARLLREVRIQERVLLVFTEERERARLLELRDLSSVEVVDRAVPPIHKSSPRRGLIGAGAFALALVAGFALAWSREHIRARH